jgi:putative membrane protein
LLCLLSQTTNPILADGNELASEQAGCFDITSVHGLKPGHPMRVFAMKRTLISAVACGLMATVAVAQAQIPRSRPAPSATGATQPAPSAQDFVNEVAISDMFEIQASQLALSKEPDRDTKPFAQKMVTDHQKTSSELKSLIDSGKVKATLPSALDSDHQKMLDDFKAKSGKDFDQSYDQMQVKAHQDAVAGGDDRELKKWAAKTLPNLKRHLTMAQKLK